MCCLNIIKEKILLYGKFMFSQGKFNYREDPCFIASQLVGGLVGRFVQLCSANFQLVKMNKASVCCTFCIFKVFEKVAFGCKNFNKVFCEDNQLNCKAICCIIQMFVQGVVEYWTLNYEQTGSSIKQLSHCSAIGVGEFFFQTPIQDWKLLCLIGDFGFRIEHFL